MSDTTDLYASVANLVTTFGRVRDQMIDHLGGSAVAGPTSNGFFNITVADGSTQTVPSVNRIYSDLQAVAATFTTTSKGSVPISPGGSSAFLRADGTWAFVPATIPLSGDVTSANGVASISNTAVTLAKMANLPATTIIGNNTVASGAPISLTGAQVNALLPTFTPNLAGIVPASGGGLAGFLRADGSWMVPAGTGPGAPAFNPVYAVGTGASQVIALPVALTDTQVSVFVNGVYQKPTVNYTISGSALTISKLAGDVIVILSATGGYATWNTLTSIPNNLSALTGSENINNSLLDLTQDTGGVGGRVRARVISGGAPVGNFQTLNDGIQNAVLVMNPNGTLSGGGASGQTTIGGLGYTGSLNATTNTPRGNWSPSSILYALNDMVYYNGTMYVCILGYTSTATVPSADTTHWTRYTPATLDDLNDGSSFVRFIPTERSKLTGVATNATKNYVTYSTTAPASPTAGDFWTNTSSMPFVHQVYSGTAWQVVSSYVTNTQHITDGANLGGTALWGGVTGTGKAADYATVGAQWGTNLTGRPSNLSSLVGGEGILNTLVTMNANGSLGGAGTGNVLLGAGGLGYLGDLNATYGATWNSNITGTPLSLTDGRVASGLNSSGGIDFSAAFHLNKSFANIDSVAATRFGTMATGATANAPRGVWSPASVVYAANDMVFYNGTLYICILGYTSTATVPSADATHWTKYSPATLDDLNDGTSYFRFIPAERTKLTGVAAGATVGAQTGVNLLDSGGFSLTDAAIKNTGITISAGALNGIGAGTGTIVQNNLISLSLAGALSGGGGGAIAYDSIADGTTYGKALQSRLNTGKPLIDFSEAIHLNKSLANVDASQNTKLVGIAAGATVGAQSGVNLLDSGGLSLTDAAIKNTGITISAGALNGIGAGTGTVIQNSLISLSAAGALGGGGGGQLLFDSLADGTTYAKPLAARLNLGKPLIDFSEAIHLNKSLANVDASQNTKLVGIATGATVGAQVGVNFLDQTGASIATDAAIKNSSISISPSGTLLGGTAGSITALDFTNIAGATKPANNATSNIPRGLWSAASVVYAANDMVYYNGTLYICILGYTSTATVPSADTTHWTKYSPATLDDLGDGTSFVRFIPTERTKLTGVATNATLGATWGTDVGNRPANLSTLAGTEGIQNSLVSLTTTGGLSGGGAGSITALDFGNVAGTTKPANNATVGAQVGVNFLDQTGASIATDAAIKNTAITITAGALNGIGAGAGTTVQNSLISLSSTGALSGGSGGSITGLDFGNVAGTTKPANNATVGAQVGSNLLDQAGVSIATDAAIKNSSMSLSPLGVLNGGSGGSITGLDFANIAGTTKPQNSADVTTSVAGPTTGAISYDSTGATVQSAISLNYTLNNYAGPITSGVTMTYKVTSGSINTFTSASAVQTITVNGTCIGNFPINTLETDLATATVTATLGSVSRTLTLTITKVKATPPATAPGTASQSSAFIKLITPWTTYAAFTNVLSLTIPSGKSSTTTTISLSPGWQPVRFSGTALSPVQQPNNGPWHVLAKLQRSASGANTWVDVGAVLASSPDPYIDISSPDPAANPGSLGGTIVDTGLTAGTAYDYRCVGVVSTGATSGNVGGIAWIAGGTGGYVNITT